MSNDRNLWMAFGTASIILVRGVRVPRTGPRSCVSPPARAWVNRQYERLFGLAEQVFAGYAASAIHPWVWCRWSPPNLTLKYIVVQRNSQ
jgi:hypothetical protein